MEYLTTPEVRRLLKVSEAHLWRLRRKGVLPPGVCARVGTAANSPIRWNLEALQKWLEENDTSKPQR